MSLRPKSAPAGAAPGGRKKRLEEVLWAGLEEKRKAASTDVIIPLDPRALMQLTQRIDPNVYRPSLPGSSTERGEVKPDGSYKTALGLKEPPKEYGTEFAEFDEKNDAWLTYRVTRHGNVLVKLVTGSKSMLSSELPGVTPAMANVFKGTIEFEQDSGLSVYPRKITLNNGDTLTYTWSSWYGTLYAQTADVSAETAAAISKLISGNKKQRELVDMIAQRLGGEEAASAMVDATAVSTEFRKESFKHKTIMIDMLYAIRTHSPGEWSNIVAKGLGEFSKKLRFAYSYVRDSTLWFDDGENPVNYVAYIEYPLANGGSVKMYSRYRGNEYSFGGKWGFVPSLVVSAPDGEVLHRGVYEPGDLGENYAEFVAWFDGRRYRKLIERKWVQASAPLTIPENTYQKVTINSYQAKLALMWDDFNGDAIRAGYYRQFLAAKTRAAFEEQLGDAVQVVVNVTLIITYGIFELFVFAICAGASLVGVAFVNQLMTRRVYVRGHWRRAAS